jgi:Macrocin-O-methyltransferase (TylF)
MISEDWEFNILDVYNFRRPGPLEGYFTFVREHHQLLPGDLLEAGVYRGKSLLGMALMLKELGSPKKIYGYDTWSGFPPVYSPQDALERWDDLLHAGRISPRHFEKTRLQVAHRALGSSSKTIDSSNISLSGNFSACSRTDLERKLAYLELDNVVLVEGSFDRTMNGAGGPERLMAALIDADLYASYQVALPFIWSRLARGGYVYLDEYYSLKFPGALIACDEFFADRADKPQRHDHAYGDFERWYVRKIFDGRG